MAGVWYLMKLFKTIRLLLITAGWLFALLRVQAAETSLIAFELDSHDKQTYTELSWRGRPLMVFVSTREAAAHNAGLVWSGPLAGAVMASSADVALIRIGTLPRGVPRLFAGMVRDAIAPTDGDPVRIALLDWDGLFAQRYELAGDAYNVLLFDRAGGLVYSVALGAFDQQRLDDVLGELRGIAARL